MIDVQKMKDAFASTPDLKRGRWVTYTADGARGGVCAISALLIHAGISYELLRAVVERSGVENWGVVEFVGPVLAAAYGISHEHTLHVVHMFDNTPNEWEGVQRVITYAEQVNASRGRRMFGEYARAYAVDNAAQCDVLTNVFGDNVALSGKPYDDEYVVLAQSPQRRRSDKANVLALSGG